MVHEAPLRHDRAAARHDAGHAFCCERHVLQQHAGVDREIVHSLFGLFDQRVAIDLPSEILHLAVDFFNGLVNGHRADRHRRIAQNPFPRFMDVLAG